MLGEVIKNLLLISGHIGQFDSSLALQNMQIGQYIKKKDRLIVGAADNRRLIVEFEVR